MSFDLGVFYTATPHTDKDASRRYVAYCEERNMELIVEPSPKIRQFLNDLTARYPQIDDVAEDKMDDCPWSISVDVSEGHVIMPMRWDRADEISKIIIDLAKKYALVCFDPQRDKIVTAPDGIYIQSTPWWKFW